VVAAAHSGLKEAAGEAAVLPVDQFVLWKREIHRLMTDPEYYEERSASAKTHAAQFDMQDAVRKFEALAENLLTLRGRPVGSYAMKLNKAPAPPRVAFFGPWVGEFGWEVATWQGWCRKESKKYDKSYVCSFPGMAPLYEDFAEFVPHNYTERPDVWVGPGVDFAKIKYRLPKDVGVRVNAIQKFSPGGDFIKFGDVPIKQFDCLVHAMRHKDPRKLVKEYPEELWREVVRGLPERTACIGTKKDLYIEGTTDLRGIPLKELMNHMAGCDLVVGASSGPMHLASFCGTTIVVWGPAKQSFVGGSLEVRYIKLWNPFRSKVHFIPAENWRPSPRVVLANALSVLGARE